ncbi:MAG: TolC family protein [Gemmatimonadetes bacterium]|nr:TolC family protein [Gemmatimonadota bacterium]
MAMTARVARTGRGTARVALAMLMAAATELGSAGSTAAQVAGAPESLGVDGTIELDLELMVDLALSSSYRVRQLNLGIDRTQLRLRSQRARLRSSVDLELSAPDYRSITENRWNANLGREELIHEDSRRLEAELAVRQPVIVFGYPTNGYLSLNNRIYRYTQVDESGDTDLRYYNRAFVSYTQPLFQPNELKNDLEEAELDLEDAELGFYEDVVEIVEDVSGDYFGLFEEAYGAVINESHVANLAVAEQAATTLAEGDPSRGIELGQIRVELANAREQLQQARSEFRLEATSLKTRLNIPESDSIALDPVIDIRPVAIDAETATTFALELTPRMRQLDINYRENELNLDQTRGRGGVQVDVRLTYGREMQDPIFAQMWGEPTNTYTIDVNGSIPIWDWGERKYRIQAAEVGLRQTDLRREEVESQIRASVQSEVRNVTEYQSRALAMEENLELARQLSAESLELYSGGGLAVVDLLQTLRREADTAENLLDAYLGWRRSITRLQEMTFYDFERGVPVLERFGIEIPGAT